MENGVSSREIELNKKVAESQRKLAILLQQQDELAKMTSLLNNKCQAIENEESQENKDLQEQKEQVQIDNNEKLEMLDSDTGVIINKLEELEHKKERIDHLLHELQAVQLLEFVSSA